MNTIENLKAKISAIDSRVSQLERIHDRYMASKGEMNESIYNEIQTLMDERDECFIELQKIGA